MNKFYIDIREIDKRFKQSAVLLLFMLLGLFQNNLQATHIIGGEVNYTCLGDEQYEVELTVYRDCFFGADNAFFDDPASIGIFDANGNLLDELRLPFLNNDTLTPILSDSCLFVPDNVCVHTASYRGEVHLPFSPGGYTMVYQRCCRNETISNIIDPLNTGATFTAEISETSLMECNSGPKFREFPPLFICVNEPINWDHSAIDAEGDSLVYSLCAPFSGGDIINNQPQPPNPPPYNTVVWQNGFGVNNILGGPDVLAIDPATGLLTGTPIIQGQFVVGVCIQEYKDGELISTSRRDFQYNVGECGIVSAGIGNDTIQCENQDLTLINTSNNANDFEWFFGDANNPGLNSIEENPTYMFPDTGVFTITLIAEPNGECADTLVQDILFKNSTIEVDFDLLVLECVDSVLLTVNNMSVDTFLGIEVYDWQLSDGQSSSLPNPSFILAESQEYTLSLNATAFDGCSDFQEFTFFGNVIQSGVIDTFNLCPGESVTLNENPFLGPNVSYSWSPSTGLDNPDSPNPTATPEESTIYTVTIVDPALDCSGSFSILVDVQEDNAIILLDDNELFCTDTYTITAQTEEIVSYEWSQNPDFTSLISTESSFDFDESGNQTFYLRTVDERGCSFTDEISIRAGALNVNLDNFPTQACLNNSFSATATNTDSADDVMVIWEPATAVLSGQGTLNAVLDPVNIGLNTYIATINNQFGCQRIDTFVVNVVSDMAIEEPDVEINRDDCNPNIVAFLSDHINIQNYNYLFEDGTLIAGASNIDFTFPGPGEYTVILTPQDFVACEFEDVVLNIEVSESFFDAGFTSELLSCGDEIAVALTSNSSALSGDITSVTWTFDNGLVASGETVDLSFDAGGVFPFTLTLLSDLGCEESFENVLDLSGSNVLDVSFLDEEILSCNGDPVALNPNGNILFSYTWSPPTDLSSSTAVSPLASPTITTNYTVTVIDPVSGCEVQRELTVFVPEQQLETNFSWAFENCIGEALIQFTDESVYSEADIVAWEWDFGNGITSDEQNPQISFSSADDLIVNLTVFTEDGCTETFEQNVDVDLIELNLPEDNTLVCLGSSIELNPNGSDAYSYEWSPATGLNTVLGASPIATPLETTTYSVTVTDGLTGCIVEQEFTLQVPSEEIQVDIDFEVLSCDGDGPIEVQFTNASSYADTALANFDWTFVLDGQGPNATQNSQNVNPVITLDEEGILLIELTVVAENGCEATAIFEQEINRIEFDLEQEELTICDNVPTPLNPNGNTNLTYSWSPTTGLDNPNAANPFANPSESTVYTVSISNPVAGECTITREVSVIIPVEEVDVDFDVEFLTCGNQASLQFTDLTSVTGTDIIAWSWDFGNGMTSDEQNPIITIDESTMLNPVLTVTTSAGCQVELLTPQSLPVELILIDDNTFEDMLNICMGEDIFLNEEPDTQYEYLWSPADNLDDPTSPNPLFINAQESQIFTVTITNISLDTCSIERTVSVNVYDAPTPSIDGDGQEDICTSEGQLSVNLATGETVVWYDDPAFTDIISTQPTITTTPGTGTTYFAMVTNQFGCGSEVVEFFSTSRILDIEGDNNSLNLCIDDETELSASVLSNEIPTEFVWSPENQIDEFLSNTSVVVSPTEPTTYTLTVSNEFGCTDETTFDVDVTNLGSQVEAEISTTDLITGQPVTLSVTENDNYTYSWSPAELLDDPTSANPTFTLEEEVTFEVTVTDENGCFVVLAVVVVPADTPCAEPFVFVPNAFTPNGDGLNDQLRVDGNQITEMYLAIYNRWGERIFEATNQSQTWDGTFEGKPLNPDVFGYIFTATCSNGDTFSSQGNISLLK